MTESLAIIVFAYNEAENLGAVLRELREYLAREQLDAELIAVDDGSNDATFAVARASLNGARSQLLRHTKNRGIGAALKTGVRAARSDWVTFMPADGQIAPEAIGTLWRAAQGGDVDVVFSTYAHRDDGWHRSVLSFGVRALVRAVHGVTLHSDGPYLFRRALFDPDALPPDTFFLNFEFPIRMLLAGRRTRNVVIECRPRRAGVSKSTGLRRIAGVARDLVDFRVRRLLE